MIKILQIAASAGRAGGETYLIQLARRLDRSKFHLGVLCPSEGPLTAELKKLQIPCVILPLEGGWTFFKAIFQLRRIIRTVPIDVVQSHGLRPNVCARLASLGTGIPAISTYHVSPAYGDVRLWKRLFYVLLDRWTRPLAKTLLCVSEKLKSEISGRKGRRWMVIPNGVDTTLFDPRKMTKEESKDLLGLKRSETILTLVGRLTYQKGHRILLEALKSLAEKKITPKTLFVGNGPLEEELRKFAQDLGLESRCFFLGSRLDIPQILAASDIVVAPSLSEGMPYAILEAMAMEKPVIASRVQGLSEIISDGEDGFLVKPGNPQILAQKIEELLENRDKCREAGKKARNTIKNRYNLEKWINSLQTLYEQLVVRGA